MALFTGEPRTANVVALEETEVLEIGHAAMKQVFDTNPDLVESLSFIITERRAGPGSHKLTLAIAHQMNPPASFLQSNASSVFPTVRPIADLSRCPSEKAQQFLQQN